MSATIAGTAVAVTSESAACSQTARQSSTNRPNRPVARISAHVPELAAMLFPRCGPSRHGYNLDHG